MPVTTTIQEQLQQAFPTTVERRRDFHRHPELGFQETRTAKRVAELLTSFDLDVIKTGVARTGVVGLLKGKHPGKTVLLRADMDGLPVQETSKLEYASVNPGVMHACGHDAHIAMLLAVAETLSKNRDAIHGQIKFMFQPAEEGPGGAQPMIDAGLLKDPPVDAALAFHVWNNLPVGQIGVRSGPCFASTDQIEITVVGRSGHGAMPHLSVDAIVIAAQVITGLQAIISRQVSPIDSAVITIGTIEGGDRHNIIPERVHMTGTVRTFRKELRETMPARIEHVVKGITEAMGGTYEYVYEHGYPVTVNDETICETVRRAAGRVVGPENVIRQDPTMGAEDMSYVLEQVPGCYFMVGSANATQGLSNPHHHHHFDIDEQALAWGARVMAEAALEFLNQD